MPGCYWKVEEERRPWNWIEATPAEIRKAVKQGAMYTTWMSFEFQPKDENEPKRYGHFVLDFDDKKNPQNALNDMRSLCLVHLPEIHDVDPCCIEYYASGSKGFHAVVPFWVFDHNGHTYLPLIYKKIAIRLAATLQLRTLDLSLYSMGKGKMFRLPNVRRKIGTYKVPLTIDEVMHARVHQLFKLTKAPRNIDRIEVDEIPSQSLSNWFDRAAHHVEDFQISESEPLPAGQLEKLKNEMPSCIRYLLNKKPPKSEHLNFNRAVMLLVNFSQDTGLSFDQAYLNGQDFLSNYDDTETYVTPEKRNNHFKAIWKYMLKNAGYFFSCERALGLQMPQEAYQCQKCIKPAVIKTIETDVVKSEAPDDSENFPYQVITGAASNFANVYAEVMEAPKHFLFMAYLTALGAYFATNVTIKSVLETQPRLYSVLVGESANDRKSTTLNKVVMHFRDAFVDFNSCWGIGSAEGMQRVLKEKDEADVLIDSRVGTLLVFDELKSFVSKCKIDNSVLLPIVNSLFESNIYETHTKTRDFKVEDAYLSILAATTKETYERIYSPAFISIGFPNRVFLIPGNAQRKFSVPPELPEDYRKQLHSNLITMKYFVGSGIVFDFSDRAKVIYHEWYMSREDSVHARRLDTYSLRLAQLLALNNMKQIIDSEIIQGAIDLCDWQLKIRKLFDPIDADSKIAEMEIKIRRFLNRGALADRELKQKTHASRAGLWIYNQSLRNLKIAKEVAWNKKEKKWHSID